MALITAPHVHGPIHAVSIFWWHLDLMTAAVDTVLEILGQRKVLMVRE